MPILENLSEADFRGLFTAQSWKKARGYLNRVVNQARVGQTLTAQVRGTYLYDVEIEVKPTGFAAQCSCLYDWGGYCKHIGAVLLKWLQEPRSFTTKTGTTSPPASNQVLETVASVPRATYRPQHLPFWLTTPFTERHLADRKQLEQGLEQHRMQDLRDIAANKGWRVKGTRKAELAQQLAEHTLNPGAILRAVVSLDKEHKQVFRAMMLLGTEDTFQLEDLERVAKIWGELNSYKKITTYTRHLCDELLALPGALMYSHTARSDYVPRAIARHVPPVLEEVIAADAELQGAANAPRLAEPFTFVRAANQIALLLEQTPTPLRPPMPRPTVEKLYPGLVDWDYIPAEILEAKRKGDFARYGEFSLTIPPPAPALPDEAMARLTPIAGDETRLELMYSLLVEIGIFQPGSPVTVWQEIKEQFLRRGELAQRAILARAYFRLTTWSIFWNILRANRELHLKRVWGYTNFKPPNLYADLVRFRQLVLRVLAALPDNQWVTLNELYPLMRKVMPNLAQTMWQTFRYYPTMGTWFLSKNGEPLRAENVVDWDQSAGEFIRQMITGPLHWLGLADLHFANEKLHAARFHGLADLYWDKTETPAVPSHATAPSETITPADAVSTDAYRITVDPTAVSAQAHGLLDKIARLETATADRFVYELDAQATYESFEAGAALPEIVEDWEKLMQIPLPKALHKQLETWWNSYGQIRIYEDLTIIEFADEFALAEMKAVTPLEQYLIAELSPSLVVITPEALEPLKNALEKAGYTPKETDEL